MCRSLIALEFRTFLAPNVFSGYHFFHLWQILSRDPCTLGPVVTLDLVNGNVYIVDVLRPKGPRPSIPVTLSCFWNFKTTGQLTFNNLRSYWNQTIVHSLNVTYGMFGSLNYSATAITLNTRTPLIFYTAMGNMGSQTSIKVRSF